MVYAGAAKKTGAYIVLALVLSLSIITFMSGDIAPTGRVTSPGLATASEADMLLPFVLGFIVGVLALGAYFYVAHIEMKR